MMKKTLAAVAVLGAFAGAACAADVQLYGRIDYGFDYKNVDYGVANIEDASTFGLNSGINTANRVGLKAAEDLGNGLTVGFVLENGFQADNGQFKTAGTLFDRESQMYVQGSFGKIGFGRMGMLGGGAGSYSLLGGAVSPFSTGWNDIGNHNMVLGSFAARINNAVAYVSPEFAGFKVHAQYSFGNGTDNHENPAREDRYMGLGVTYDLEALHLVALFDMTNENSARAEQEDGYRMTLAGSYDFGVAKAYLMGQYFKDVDALNGDWAGSFENKSPSLPSTGYRSDELKGYGLVAGVTAPLGGGNLYGMVGYMDAEKEDANRRPNEDFTRFQVALGYDYKLSKSTTLYTAAGYYQDDNGMEDRQELKVTEVVAGMVYAF